MEQFSLDKWLKDKSRKVVTRDGRPVRIICWDVKGPFPILALIMGNGEMDTKVGEEYPCSYKVDGTCPVSDSYNLFFADEEEESTEFEKALLAAFNCVAGKAVTTIGAASFQEDVDEWSKPLLDLARKELEKEDWRKPLRVYKNGYKQGKQDALKHLPKWKKATEHKKFVLHVCVIDEDMCPFLDTEVEEGEYYIELDDLKTLPKEE